MSSHDSDSSLLQVLNPKAGERIVDVGCGSGDLTNEIRSASGALVVIGIDVDAKMIAQAQEQYPECEFIVEDARNFVLEEPVDAVVSKATLHWIPDATRVVTAISRALKPGGRFVAEFGGKGNLEPICSYLDRTVGCCKNPWYFPTISEYTTLLENHGFEVTFASLSDRPTPLPGGKLGLRNWIVMFENIFLKGLDEEEREQVLAGAERELRPSMHNGEEWVAVCRSLRIVAIKL